MKNEFKVGESVSFRIYDVDSLNHQISKEVKGVVKQVTKDLIVLDNGKYMVSYQKKQLIKDNGIKVVDEPYLHDVEDYYSDIMKDCVDNLKNGKSGFLYSKAQYEDLCNYFNEKDLDVNLDKESEIYEIRLRR